MRQVDRVKVTHEMHFGPRLQDGGGAEFRLWAPQAKTVSVSLIRKPSGKIVEMSSGKDGWFSATIDNAGEGTWYQFVIDGDLRVPDPASRYQPEDAHGPSQIIDSARFDWGDQDWKGRPWEEAVIYELHTGAFSADGTFEAVVERLDHLERLGVTAIELMPVSDFPGDFNWGYDGVLLFAPDSSYGTPDDLKLLVKEAHSRGIMVFLDVVYNHFGPDGNYMHVYANSFFSQKHKTPWGSGINYDGKGSDTVRSFVVNNVLYWLEEYRLDGLRFDAVDTIRDTSSKHILTEIAEAVERGPGSERHVHLILENISNDTRVLKTENEEHGKYTAQWNDDLHHSLHVLLTGETGGYYVDFCQEESEYSALEHLGRTLADGFTFRGQKSRYWGKRGTESSHMAPTSFISFLQNHDQVGNRAMGERITTLAESQAVIAAASIVLLAPSPPMVFMGEEWGSRNPFCWFASFEGQLAESVRKGRLKEFSRFSEFSDPEMQSKIPDPCHWSTFESAKLDWESLESEEHRQWLELYSELIETRKKAIIPHIKNIDTRRTKWKILEEGPLSVDWPLKSGGKLKLFANLTDQGNPSPLFAESEFDEESILFESQPGSATEIALGTVPPWAVIWFLSSS